MERLLEHGAADMGKLLTMAASFSAEEMLQVAEERKLAQLCGYPLCQQPPARRKCTKTAWGGALVMRAARARDDGIAHCAANVSTVLLLVAFLTHKHSLSHTYTPVYTHHHLNTCTHSHPRPF